MPQIRPQIVSDLAPQKTVPYTKPVKRTVKNNNRADRGDNKKRGNSKKLTVQDQRKALASQLGLKPKTKEFIDLLLDNPKMSQTEAWKLTHKTDNSNTAAVEASNTLRKPKAVIYKDSAIKKAKERIVSLVDSENESIALKSSQDIIDRTEGKAQQKDGELSRTVRVEIDLTGVKLGNHYLTPQQLGGEA